MVSAYREYALELRAAKNKISADLYDKVADTMEQEIIKSLTQKPETNTQKPNQQIQQPNRGARTPQTNPANAGMPPAGGNV
jgi:hypothetical protein